MSDLGDFDDPALKAALKRTAQGPAPSPQLRDRVREILASAPAQVASRRTFSLRNPVFSLAAAAIVLLFIGSALYVFQDVIFTGGSSTSSYTYALPAGVAAEMVKTHDFCCAQPDHHQVKVPDDFTIIRQTLSKQLGRPVLAENLDGGYWKFHGAGLCPVGKVTSAHLVFSHDKQFVSVFSLPYTMPADAKGTLRYDVMESGHPISGFAEKSGLFCIVGSSPDGSLSANSLIDLRDKLMNDFHKQSARATECPGAGQSTRMIVAREQ